MGEAGWGWESTQRALVFYSHTLEGGLVTANRVEGGSVAEEVRSGRSTLLFLKSSLRAKFCFKKMGILGELVS